MQVFCQDIAVFRNITMHGRQKPAERNKSVLFTTGYVCHS